MKSKLLLVLFGVCFSLFLFLGIRASQSMFSGDEVHPGLYQITAGPILIQEEPGESQSADPFTLIILVDDLNSLNPLLEGVWLSRVGENHSSRLFFPIFPSQADDGAERDLNLRGAFWFEEPGKPSSQFLTILKDRNLSWGDLLFLDLTTLAEIGQILGEIDPNYQPLNSVGLAGLSYSVENRLAVQVNQALFIAEICQQLPLPGQNELMQRFLDGFASHLVVSGTTPLDFYQAWQATSYCYFPTMTLPAP
jgi:hypothetical protein